ncbi:hypothetical protein AGMMS50268_15520 [Spirochaetia bacterium]|nr:hypothetical protein AGMMS50268_15520 [Spirochaetia bacterium]
MGSTRYVSRFPLELPHVSCFSILLLILLLPSLSLYAQNEGALAPGVLVGAEIQNIEKTLGASGLSGSRRHEALVKLARLYELSGNIEGAARAWTNAATADAGNRDDLALVKGAACFAAMGEWEKAEEAVKPALLTGRDKQTLIRARLLGAQIGAFKSAAGGTSAGNPAATLMALLEDPDYAVFKPSIYYTLWKTSSADTWKTRLLAEFPRSPEGRIAASAGTAAESAASTGAVSAAPTAMWLLIPGREGAATERPGSAGTVAAAPSAPTPAAAPISAPSVAKPAQVTTNTAPAAAPGTSTATAPASTGTSAANTGAVLQTGFFSVEGNAQVMAERLKKAGFTPAISRRTINGKEGWVVNVPAGSDAGATILQLKNAGVESFLVSN